MKKKLSYFLLFLLAGICACSDDVDNRIEGLWQLKTIKTNGIITPVDTVFYGFMRGQIFSYIILTNPDESNIYYGYINKISDKEMEIEMDATYFSRYQNYNYLDPDWVSNIRTFDISELNSKHLTLSDPANNTVYSFNKH